MAGATQKFSPTGHPRRNLSFPRGARIPPKSMAQELQSTTKTGTGGGGGGSILLQSKKRRGKKAAAALISLRGGEASTEWAAANAIGGEGRRWRWRFGKKKQNGLRGGID